jgi:hypothetical protein
VEELVQFADEQPEVDFDVSVEQQMPLDGYLASRIPVGDPQTEIRFNRMGKLRPAAYKTFSLLRSVPRPWPTEAIEAVLGHLPPGAAAELPVTQCSGSELYVESCGLLAKLFVRLGVVHIWRGAELLPLPIANRQPAPFVAWETHWLRDKNSLLREVPLDPEPAYRLRKMLLLPHSPFDVIGSHGLCVVRQQRLVPDMHYTHSEDYDETVRLGLRTLPGIKLCDTLAAAAAAGEEEVDEEDDADVDDDFQFGLRGAPIQLRRVSSRPHPSGEGDLHRYEFVRVAPEQQRRGLRALDEPQRVPHSVVTSERFEFERLYVNFFTKERCEFTGDLLTTQARPFPDALLLTLLMGDTGAGKSTAAQLLMHSVLQRQTNLLNYLPARSWNRVIYVAPRLKLVDEMYEAMLQRFDGNTEVVKHYKRDAATLAKARLVCTTFHSLHKLQGPSQELPAAAAVPGAAEPPQLPARRFFVESGDDEGTVLVVIDEATSIILEDMSHLEVSRPERFDPAFATLLFGKASQLCLLDANLPPPVVVNYVRRISHYIRKQTALPARFEFSLYLQTMRATFSMVREQRRECTVFTAKNGDLAVLERVRQSILSGEPVAVFCASIKTLEFLQIYFATLLHEHELQPHQELPPDTETHPRIHVVSSKAPEMISNEEILNRRLLLLLYTTAVSSGVNILTCDTDHFKRVAVVCNERHSYLSLIQLYQAVSRVRRFDELLLNVAYPLSPFELAQDQGEKTLNQSTLASHMQSLVKEVLAQKSLKRTAVAVVAEAANRDAWLPVNLLARAGLGDWVRERQADVHPLHESMALNGYYRSLKEPRARSAYLLSLLSRVGYEITLNTTRVEKVDARLIHGRKLEAEVKADVIGTLLAPDATEDDLTKLLRQTGLQGLQEPRHAALLEVWRYHEPLTQYVSRLMQWASPQLLKIIDIAMYFRAEVGRAVQRAEAAQASVHWRLLWRQLIADVVTFHFGESELQQRADSLRRLTKNLLDGDTLDLYLYRSGEGTMILRALLFFGAFTCAFNDMSSSFFPVQFEPQAVTQLKVQLPCIRDILERRGRLRFVGVAGEWLQDLSELVKSRRAPAFITALTQGVDVKRLLWNASHKLYERVLKIHFGAIRSPARRKAVVYEGPELLWLSELYEMWRRYNNDKLRVSPQPNGGMIRTLMPVPTVQRLNEEQQVRDDGVATLFPVIFCTFADFKRQAEQARQSQQPDADVAQRRIIMNNMCRSVSTFDTATVRNKKRRLEQSQQQQ